jgi:hypothetical protein
MMKMSCHRLHDARLALPPLGGVDHPSWSSYNGRVGLALPRLLYDSGGAIARGEGKRKEPRSGRQRPRLDPSTPSSEIIAAPPVAPLLLALASPSLWGRGRKAHPQMVAVYHSSRRVFLVPVGCHMFFMHRFIRTTPPVPSPCGLRFSGDVLSK